MNAAVPDAASAAFEAAERIATVRGWLLFLARYGDTRLAEKALESLAAIDPVAARDWSPELAERSLALTSAQRGLIQLHLNAAGFEIEEPDGELDAATREQLKRYQTANNLNPTGFVSPSLLARFKLQVPTPDISVRSHATAKRYDPADLALLEADARVLRAARCLSGSQIIYGEFRDHLYVVVLARHGASYLQTPTAKECGAYPVAIGSKAENDFIYNLFRDDARILHLSYSGGYTLKKGPLIGLRQADGAREPGGGWEWSNGEPVRYTNWSAGQPDNYKGDLGNQKIAAYFASRKGRHSMEGVEARAWDDQSTLGGAGGFVLEFE